MAQITNIQDVDVTVSFENNAGLAVSVRNIVWGSQDETLVTVTADTVDAAKAVVSASGNVGATKIFVDAEYVVAGADGAEVVYPVHGEADVEVADSGVVFASFTFGEPRNQG